MDPGTISTVLTIQSHMWLSSQLTYLCPLWILLQTLLIVTSYNKWFVRLSIIPIEMSGEKNLASCHTDITFDDPHLILLWENWLLFRIMHRPLNHRILRAWQHGAKGCEKCTAALLWLCQAVLSCLVDRSIGDSRALCAWSGLYQHY